MSILIKGIEMPTACMTIRIYRDGECVRHPQGTVIKGVKAVEVTTPHGRLIDADALEDSEMWDEDECEYARIFYADDIDNAPTVIEAEGRENE